jgi:hypothetical protein
MWAGSRGSIDRTGRSDRRSQCCLLEASDSGTLRLCAAKEVAYCVDRNVK